MRSPRTIKAMVYGCEQEIVNFIKQMDNNDGATCENFQFRYLCGVPEYKISIMERNNADVFIYLNVDRSTINLYEKFRKRNRCYAFNFTGETLKTLHCLEIINNTIEMAMHKPMLVLAANNPFINQSLFNTIPKEVILLIMHTLVTVETTAVLSNSPPQNQGFCTII